MSWRFPWGRRGSSERELRAGEEGFLVFAVGAVGRAVVELRLRVVRDQLEVAIEVPVHAHPPGPGLAGHAGGIGEQRERILVDVQFSIARLQLPGTPACTAYRKRMVRLGYALVAGVFAGQHVTGREAPGAIVQRFALSGRQRHFLARTDVFAEDAERIAVVIGLRRPVRVFAIGDDVAAVIEELHLPRSAIARQEAVAAALFVAAAAADAEPQPGQRVAGVLPRLGEQARDQFEVVVGIGGGAVTAVGSTVEHTEGV